ncbi:hypothetical protein A4X09_0g2632 [Tilletia walkeri]|uniref:RRM domain-containing protein n=1 Tax=Tilletia walkeri TaxID=117179 RepID=A0A8X7NAY9_9BASI|nr:hypothetical protein A4X09_0g2632 [Tilletia walkeri]
MAARDSTSTSTTDPEILNNALRALSLDISSAHPTDSSRGQSQGKGSADESLVSPQQFEAPTPLSTPILPYDGGASGPFGSLGRSDFLADGLDWDREWSSSEALSAQRRQQAAAKDGKQGDHHRGSTPTSGGAENLDHTPPATPRAGGNSTSTPATSMLPSKAMSGTLPSSAAKVTNSNVITPTVRVRAAAGDALEIATRLQQQQQQQQHQVQVFDSYRTPTGQQLETPSLASLGNINNNLFSPQNFSTDRTNIASSLGSTLGSLRPTASIQQRTQESHPPLVGAPGPTATNLTSSLLGSAFVSPGHDVTGDAVAGATFKNAMNFAGKEIPGGAGCHPTPPPPSTSAINAAMELSGQLDPFMSPGMSLDPASMLFQNEQTANVYVNALPLTTTDDDLYRIGSAFGTILSHKAIIAAETGLCKGYGFLLYTNRDAAEHAIECLGRMGLQASFAKESFSARLRRMADKASANVYLSNLPTDMTTHQLEHLFAPHNVVSMRILLNSDGTSRGVGFVRLRDRDIAHDCIDRLHGKMLPGCASPLQVRFADSEGQKLLKRNAMMQNSINALNAQARDVLRSTGPGSTPSMGAGVGIGMGMEMGMPSPSASPHVNFPLPVTTPSAMGGSPMSAGITSHYYLPYSPTPPTHAQAHSAASGLLNTTSAYGALQHQHQQGQQSGGLGVNAGLPTPGPSPSDANAATASAMAAIAAAQGHAHIHDMSSQTPGFAGAAYNFSPSPLLANVHAHTQLFGGAAGTGATMTAAGPGPGRLVELASPITPNLAISRAPASNAVTMINTATAPSVPTTMPTGRMLSPYAATSSAASLGNGMNVNMNLAAFSPPMLNISLGAHHPSVTAASATPTQGQQRTELPSVMLTTSHAGDGVGGGVAGSTGLGYAGGITAPYSSFQLQQMLSSSTSTKPGQGQPLSNGLVAARGEELSGEQRSRGATSDGKTGQDGRIGGASHAKHNGDVSDLK